MCGNATARAMTLFCSFLFLPAACGGGGGGGGGGSPASGPMFLLAGEFGQQYFSTDLQQWTEVNGISGQYDSRGVAFGNGTYVWVGDCGAGCFGSATSATNLTAPNFGRTDFGDFTTTYEVAFGNDMFVAVGFHSSLGSIAWVSSDGITWTTNPIPDYTSTFKVAFGNGVFIADATSATAPFQDDIVVSSDGVQWIPVALTDSAFVNDVSCVDGVFIAVGIRASTDFPCAWFSANGLSWTAPVDLGDPGAPFRIGGAAGHGGTWLVVGAASGLGYAWVSTDDGQTWSTKLVGGDDLTDVIFAQGRFVAVGESGTVMTTPDGTNWTNRSFSASSAFFNTIAFIP